MTVRFSSLLLGALVLAAGAAAPAQSQRFQQHDEDQKAARRDMLDGRVMPFGIIKRRVEQDMGDATYVGTAPSPREGVYRMQFLRRDGKVIWVDVDGKTGNIIAKTR